MEITKNYADPSALVVVRFLSVMYISYGVIIPILFRNSGKSVLNFT